MKIPHMKTFFINIDGEAINEEHIRVGDGASVVLWLRRKPTY